MRIINWHTVARDRKEWKTTVFVAKLEEEEKER
jgi:hypothetical protein